MRLIDADALIDEIEERKNANGYRNVALISELNRLEGYIMRLPFAQPEQRWIPCTEALPEDCEDIIVTYVDDEETRIIPVNYDKGTWYDCIFDTALNPIKVIAWMPLPEPWRGDRMNDMISRQAAIAVADYSDCIGLSVEDVKKVTDEVVKGLKRLPSVQPQRWIPVTERLPEKYIGEWLCCTDDGQILILPYDTPGDGSKECVFYRWDDNGYMYETYNVVAWMPLPEPWEGQDEQANRR